jgi:hypothetical protein
LRLTSASGRADTWVMTNRLGTALLAGLLVIGAGCAKREAQEAAQIDNGQGAACTEERSLLEKAVQAYMLLNPDASVTEAALVSNGYLHAQSTLMDVTATGIVVPAPGSPC